MISFDTISLSFSGNSISGISILMKCLILNRFPLLFPLDNLNSQWICNYYKNGDVLKVEFQIKKKNDENFF